MVQYPACIIPYGKASKELDPDPMILTDGVQPSCELSFLEGFGGRCGVTNQE